MRKLNRKKVTRFFGAIEPIKDVPYYKPSDIIETDEIENVMLFCKETECWFPGTVIKDGGFTRFANW